MALWRVTIYTPAVTIVAAWISALTGVGPSIASGSQVCNGICADLATAPTSSRKAANSRGAESVCIRKHSKPEGGAHGFITTKTLEYVTEWYVTNRTNVPRIMPTSPITFITNALRAASTAERLWYQKPIKKYELRPTSAQPTIRKTKFPARTSSSIENTKMCM